MEAAVAGHLVWCCTECGAIYRSDFPRCPNDGAEVIAASRDPLVGSTVDSYVIEALIGEGAMGRVYRAHHRHLHDRRYALKVLIGDLAVTASSRIRFEKEAESASRLDHPNVVGVFDVGRSKRGLLYIAMELVDGESAGTILDRGPMEVSRVLRIARGVCEGLAHAHGAGIIHRDLKPDNILIVDGDVPRIVDFGLAISTDRVDARLTSTGMTMGTPAYIAPEQASGRPVDHRADLYALGVSMFEMLTQLLPFEADDPVAMVTDKVMHAAPTLEQRAPNVRVPAAVSRLVTRLLAKDPDDRFATAADVIAAIDRCEIAPRSNRRGRVVVALALAAGLATVGWSFTTGTTSVATEVSAASTVPATAASPGGTTSPPIAGAPGTADPRTAPPLSARTRGVDDVATTPAVRAANAATALTSPGTAAANAAGSPTTSATASAAADLRAATSAAADLHAASAPARVVAKERSHHHRDHARVAKSDERAREPARIEVAPAVTPDPNRDSAPPTASPIAPTAPPTVPVEPAVMRAHVTALDVSGSLSAAVIQRAIDRIAPAIAACHATAEHTATIRFTIGESRRAETIAAPQEPCLAAAFAALRTETAPDVGDASVTVKVMFR
jgi:serine/threonine-protein kinase